MNKDTEIYGVDISKDVFDVFSIKKGINNLGIMRKRFIQMKLAKVKTDKSDAKAICEYGTINEVPLYTALTEVQS